MAKVLPSDIARLVLAYLQDNDLKVTSQKFLEESPHLSEIRNNPECPVLPPQMKDLETLMEEHAVFIQEGKKRRQASPLVIQLWKKLDTVVAQLKYEYLEEKSDGLATISRKVKARQSLESLRLRQMQRKHGNCISNSSRDVPSTSQSTRHPHQSTCNSDISTTSIPVISPKRKSVTPRKKRSQEDHVTANQPTASDVPLNPEELMEFPQILESLLSDTTLPEKLAGAINKVLPPGVSSPRRLDLQNDSDLSSAIVADQRQPVGKRAVDEAIEMTCSDPAFDSLFSLFNVDREKFLEDERRKSFQDKNSDEMEKFRDSGRNYGEMSAAVARDLFPSSSTSGQDVVKSTDSGATGKRQENEEDQGSVESNRTLSKQLGATPQEERKNQTANVERSRDQPVPKTLSPRKFQCEDESMDVDADREDIMDEIHSISDDTSQSPFPQSDDPAVRDGRGAGEREAEVVRHSSERVQRASALQNEDETRRSRAGTERGIDASQEPQSKKISDKDASSDSQRKENRESKDLHYESGDTGKATSNLDPCVEVETSDRVVVGKGPKPESCATASSKGKKGEGGKKTRRRDRYKDSQATRRSQRLEAKKQQTSASVNSPCSTIEDEDEHHENPRTPSQMSTSERGLQAANEYAKRLLASMPGKESGGALDGLSPVALNITVRTASPNMECLPDPFEKGTLLSTTNSLTDCKTATSLTQTTSSVLSTRQNSEIVTTKSKMSKGKVTVLSPSGRQVGDIQVESGRKNEENVTIGGITSGNHSKRGGKSEHSQDDAVVDDGTDKLHTVDGVSQTPAKSDGIASSSAEVTTIDVSDEIKRTLSIGNEVANTKIVNIPLQYVQVATNLAANATNFAITPGQHQQAVQNNRISVSQAMDVSSPLPHLTILGGTQNIPANSNLVVCSSGDPENSSKQIVVSDMSGDWGNDSQVIMLQAADSLLSLGVVTDTFTPLGSSDPIHQGPGQPLVTLKNLNNASENSHRHTTETTLSSDVIQNVLRTSHVPQSVSGSADQLSGNRCLSNSVNISPEVLSSQNVVTTTTAAAPKVSHSGGGNHLNLDQQGVSMLMNEELERSLQNASTQDIDFIFKAITMTPQKNLKMDGVRDAIKDSKKYSPLEKAIADKLKMFTGSECQTKVDEGKTKEKVSPWKNAALQSQSRSARNKKCVRKVFADEDVETRRPHSERSVRDGSNPVTRRGENGVESTWQNRPGSEERASNDSLKYSDGMPLPNNEKSLESKGGVNSIKYKNERSLQNKEDVVREQVLKDVKGKAVFRTVGKENEEISILSGKPQKKCNKEEADGIDVRLQKRRIKDIIDQEKQQKLERRMTTRLKENRLEQKNGREAEGTHGMRTSSRRHQHENNSSPSQRLRGMQSNHGDRLNSADQDARNGFEDNGKSVQGSSYVRGSVGMDLKASREMKYSMKGGDGHGKEISPGPGGRDFARGTATSPDGVISDATVSSNGRFTDSQKVDEKSVVLGVRRKVSVTERGYPAKRKDDSHESVTKRNLHSCRQQPIPDSHARLCQQTAEGNCTDKSSTDGQWDHSSIGSSSVVEVGHRLVSSKESEGQRRYKDLSGIRGQREKYKFSDQTEILRKEDKYLEKGGKETGHRKTLGHRRSRSAVEREGTGNVTKARSNSQERMWVPSDGQDASCHDKPRSLHSSENFSGSLGLNRNDSPPSGNDQTQVEIDFMKKDYENETSYNVNSISSYELAKSGSEYRPALRGNGGQLSVPWNKLKEDSRGQSSLRVNWEESDREETHSVGSLSSSPISVTSMSPRDSWKTESDYLRDSCSRTRGYISHTQNLGGDSSISKVTTQNAANCINVHQLGQQSNNSSRPTQNSTRKEDYGRGDGGGRSFDTPERHHREREQLPTGSNDFATLGTPGIPVSKEENTFRKCCPAYDEKLHVERHARVSDENMAENRGSREESAEKGRSFGEGNHSSRRHPSPRRGQSSHGADFLRTKAATRDSGRFSMEGPPSGSKRHLETHRHHAKGDVSQYRGNNILDQDGRFSSVNKSHDSGRHSLDSQRLMEDVSDEYEDVGNPSLHHAGDLRRKLPFDGAFRKPTASWMAENNEGQPCHSDFIRENNSIDEEHRVVSSEQQQQHEYLNSRREHNKLSSQVKRLEHSERHYSQDMDHRIIDSGERPRNFEGSSGKSHLNISFDHGEDCGDASVKHSSREKFPTGVYDRQDSDHGHYNSRTKAPVFNQDRSGEWTDRRHSHGERLSVNSRASLDQRHSKRPNEASRKHASYEDSQEITENNSLKSDLRYSNKNELSSHRNLSRGHGFYQRTHVTKKTNSMKVCDETQSRWEDITAKEKGQPSNSAGRGNSDSQDTSSRNAKRRLQEIDSTRPTSSAKRKKSSKELSSSQVEQPPPACNSGDTLPSEFDLQKFLARLKYA